MTNFILWCLAHQQTICALVLALLVGIIIGTPNKRQFFE